MVEDTATRFYRTAASFQSKRRPILSSSAIDPVLRGSSAENLTLRSSLPDSRLGVNIIWTHCIQETTWPDGDETLGDGP